MDAIFHEKQEGSLCAQHCLNALLQGPYLTAVDLADIATQLDEDERERMAEGDVTSEDYQEFLKQPSSNMDDSGFFSIQVICNALRVWNIELIPFLSPEAKQARENPQNQRAFICNLQQHWLTIRKLGHQWFNLNSLLSKPELITETYLSLFLTQLQTEGYSIFVVMGKLPESEADQLLKLCPAKPEKKPAKTTQKYVNKSDLTAALQQVNKLGGEDKPVDMDEIRRRRQLYFTRQEQNQGGNPTTSETTGTPDASQQITTGPGPPENQAASSDLSEEEMLQIALQLSLEKM
ncbi:hypothetical protein ACROYT_G013119 [Oculina patagonica]